ncbi:hypothetical protein [Streptomyces sp. NPDC093094]|uniref:hypothetical protein n=1 Tax=Streptomyces sp. NPDC093094 TaxID=3366026 RepID=UPI0038008CD9
MSAIAVLALTVALLLAVVGILLAVGLGYIAHRHPALRGPLGLAVAALGVFATIAGVAVVQVVTS